MPPARATLTLGIPMRVYPGAVLDCRRYARPGKGKTVIDSACHSVRDSRPRGGVIIVTASVTAVRAQR